MKFSRLILANLSRKKIRLLFTVGSLAVALVLFTFLAVVKSAFSRGTEIAGADRLIVVSRIGLMQLLPISDRDKILAIPGVKAVTHNHWFGGVYQEEKNFFPQFVIDPENQRKVMTELVVPDDQWNNFLKDRQGAIAGARTAERFHWKIGDRIPIKTTLYGGGSSEFNLDGIYHSDRPGGDESQFWLQWKYFDENAPAPVKSTAGWYVVKLDSPDDAVRVAKAIDEKFANSSFETKTETESAFAAYFVKQFGNIELLILTIGSVVFFTLLLVTGNTMAISVRERTSELAVLKASGFSGRAVLFFVLAESVFSGRRRHTRCSRDWSSDVCSSDLLPRLAGHTLAGEALLAMDRPTGAQEELRLAEQETEHLPVNLVASSPFPSILRAGLLLGDKNIEEAEPLLQEIVKMTLARPGPDGWSAARFELEAIAKTARQSGDWNLSESVARDMIEHDPTYAGGYFALGLAAEHAGHAAEAHEQFAAAGKFWSKADKDLPELRRIQEGLSARR